MPRPTLEQAPPHFLRLVAESSAVGEVQREAGLRNGVLRLFAIHDQCGGTVHGANDLETDALRLMQPPIHSFIHQRQ